MTKISLGQAFTNTTNDIYPSVSGIDGFAGFVVWMIATWTLLPELLLNVRRGAQASSLSLAFISVPLLWLMALISALTERGVGEEMITISVLCVVALIHRRWEGWQYLRSGEKPLRHTMYLGDSVLSYLAPFLPQWGQVVRDHFACQRFLNPIVCILLGVAVALTGDSTVVAVYLIAGGVMMALKNQLIYEQMVVRVLALYNSALTPFVLPRLLEEHRDGNAEHEVSIPVSPALTDVLRHIPTPPMTDIVARALSKTVDTDSELEDVHAEG